MSHQHGLQFEWRYGSDFFLFFAYCMAFLCHWSCFFRSIFNVIFKAIFLCFFLSLWLWHFCQLFSCCFLLSSSTHHLTPSPISFYSPVFSLPLTLSLLSIEIPFMYLSAPPLTPTALSLPSDVFCEPMGWPVRSDSFGLTSSRAQLCAAAVTRVWCEIVAAENVCLFTSHSHLDSISNVFASGEPLAHTSEHARAHVLYTYSFSVSLRLVSTASTDAGIILFIYFFAWAFGLILSFCSLFLTVTFLEFYFFPFIVGKFQQI